MNRRLASGTALLLLLILFIGANTLSQASLRSARLDLTEQNLYTLTAGSRNIAGALEEPIKLTFYYSKSLESGRPALQNYGQRVRELLEEFARVSGGSITLEIVDPEPFSEAEDKVVQAGLGGLPVAANETFYFGLVGTNAVDGREVIPFFDPSQEQFLEYEVARLLYALANPEKKKIGVVSSLALDGAPPNPLQPQPQRPWSILRELRTLFDVRVIEPGRPEDANLDELDVLLIVHPMGFSDEMLYAIDQFVVGGGNAVIFVDPNCEAMPPPPGSAQNPLAGMQMDRASNLEKLFTAWGVEFDPAGVAADLTNARRVMTGGNRREAVPYVGWLTLKGPSMEPTDAVTGSLELMNLATAGILEHRSAATTTWTPLLRTSPESSRMESSRFKFFPQPKELLAEFAPSGESLVIAARLSGQVTSAFPDGPPGGAVEAPEGRPPHRTASEGDVNIIVVSDVDLLADDLWYEEMMIGQVRLGSRKLADNADFLVNALDNMAGSSDLISIRARGQFARPFKRVDELRLEAEKEYSAEEQGLQEKLRETERQLNELQKARPDSGEMILTEAQQKALQDFNAERARIRSELRRVQHDLQKDIKGLGQWLTIANVFAVPLGVAALAVVVGLYRAAGPDEVEQMSGKTLAVLLAVTVLIGAAAFVAYSKRSATAPVEVEALLYADLAERANDVASVTIQGGQETFEVAREGPGWVLRQRGGYPAQVERVKEAVVGMARLAIVEPKTSRPEQYARIGVEDPGGEAATSKLLTLKDAQGQTLASLIIGEQTYQGNRPLHYVRRSGEAQAFLVEGDVSVDSNPMGWVERNIASIPRTRVKSASISHPDGECLHVFRDDEAESDFHLAELPEGRELKYAGVTGSIASALNSLRIEDVAPAGSRPFDEGVTVTELHTFDGLFVKAELTGTDEDIWARFTVAYDGPPEAAEEEAGEAVAGAEGAEGADAAEPADEEETEEDKAAAVKKEAEELSAKLSPWVFRLSSAQASSFTKRLEELLKELPAPAAEADESAAPLAFPALPGAVPLEKP